MFSVFYVLSSFDLCSLVMLESHSQNEKKKLEHLSPFSWQLFICPWNCKILASSKIPALWLVSQESLHKKNNLEKNIHDL